MKHQEEKLTLPEKKQSTPVIPWQKEIVLYKMASYSDLCILTIWAGVYPRNCLSDLVKCG
jgi:hypothetical protein